MDMPDDRQAKTPALESARDKLRNLDLCDLTWAERLALLFAVKANRAAIEGGATPKKCPECHGTGRTDNHVTGEVECGACYGMGLEDPLLCAACGAELGANPPGAGDAPQRPGVPIATLDLALSVLREIEPTLQGKGRVKLSKLARSCLHGRALNAISAVRMQLKKERASHGDTQETTPTTMEQEIRTIKRVGFADHERLSSAIQEIDARVAELEKPAPSAPGDKPPVIYQHPLDEPGARAKEQKNADWKQAIDDALVSAHLGTVESIPDPEEALNQLLAWHQMVALDPKVSEDARNLVERGRQESAKEIARLKATVRLYREA